jgi:hypothetical protein
MDENKLKEIFDKVMLIVADVDRDGDIDRDDIKGGIERIMSVAGIVIKITPTKKDDAVFNTIVKPIVEAILAGL